MMPTVDDYSNNISIILNYMKSDSFFVDNDKILFALRSSIVRWDVL